MHPASPPPPISEEDAALLKAIKKRQLSLENLLEQMQTEWVYEDYVYRFYHKSFKVYVLQRYTEDMVAAFKNVLPDTPLNPSFTHIVANGTNKKWELSHNQKWLNTCRPIVEAFLHAKYFLEMMVKYGRELEEAPAMLPSGWAAVLYLYNLR